MVRGRHLISFSPCEYATFPVVPIKRIIFPSGIFLAPLSRHLFKIIVGQLTILPHPRETDDAVSSYAFSYDLWSPHL